MRGSGAINVPFHRRLPFARGSIIMKLPVTPTITALAALCFISSNSLEAHESGLPPNATVLSPAGAPRGVIVLLSDVAGFGRAETRLADSFRTDGNLVIGLSWPRWRAEIEKNHGNCRALLGRIEHVVGSVEREKNLPAYLTPVLAGVGAGGSVMRALAPAVRPHRIAGVIAIGSSASVETRFPACATIAPPDRRKFAKEPNYPDPRRALRELAAEDVAAAAKAAAELKGERLQGPGELADLPIEITPAGEARSILVVLLTGDGGIGRFDHHLAEALAARGAGVVTLDSRLYFWSSRAPEKVARDLMRILEHFQRDWPVRKVALAGYSFGAGVLPLAYNRLPTAMRRSVALVSLLAATPAADLRVELDDSLYPNAIPFVPEASRLDASKVQCIFGREDTDAATACPSLRAARPETEVGDRPGGHGFDGDVESLADMIMAPLETGSSSRQAVPVTSHPPAGAR
jgi:type IV secretory pathway VirJ component